MQSADHALQVDGTKGSAVASLRDCWTQRVETTPRALWNSDIEQPVKFFEGWQRIPDYASFDNAFKLQLKLFLKHAVNNEPFRRTLLEGAKGVQLAEKGLASRRQRAWVDVDPLV
jgi:predicted dehydrogenase